MLSFQDARARLLLLASDVRAGFERIAVDAAYARVLAEDVVSPRDIPSFDHSMMDGYAVRAADLADASHATPRRLTVVGEAKAGDVAGPLAVKASCRIFTGASIPSGADAVVMQEDVTRDGDHAVFPNAPRVGSFIRRRGEDLGEGCVAIARGTRLRPSHVALAATCDRAWLTVARRPVVTILATGDELRPPGTVPFPGSIPESNAVAIHAMATSAGAIARIAPIARDIPGETQRAISDALLGTDVLVTIGGASVGDHDLVRPCLEAAGVALDFWKVAMKPGKPLMVGRRGETLVLGLPGNPASAMITFALFGVPLLRRLQGDQAAVTFAVPARLTSPIHRSSGRVEFARATLARDHGTLTVTPLGNQASGAVTSLANADALICISADATSLDVGTMVDVLAIAEIGL
jgi:molybdopterin molybdotransferase